MGQKEQTTRNGENSRLSGGGGGKSKEMGTVIDNYQDSVLTELSKNSLNQDEEVVDPIFGKEKENELEDMVESKQQQHSLATRKNDDFNKKKEVVGTLKNKKKKKKSGKAAQEEDELDKILAELGEGPSSMGKLAPASQLGDKALVQPQTIGSVYTLADPVVVDDATGEKEGEEGIVESTAAKKKKKKMEKEKEKKVVASEGNKKVSKHVREIQEALARRKEAEERKKREEEERLKKEEEDWRRKEELDRQAEEARRRKKEKVKEKLLKKRKEGKPITAKQKEEHRLLEARRNQILVNAVALPLATTDTGSTTAKRPIYKTIKSKSTPAQDNGAVALIESEKVEENVEVRNAIEDNGVGEDADEDESDAKIGDDTDVIKLPRDGGLVSAKNDSSALLTKSRDVVSNKIQADAGINKTKDYVEEKEVLKFDVLSKENLRSPICCVMGHVDAGKTKLLDCIRGTNVQKGEAGGITQQIGATYLPAENIRERTKELKADVKMNVPGLLVIDTPGHESFANIRSRGSGLCDIAILVVDIMHGLEAQTKESLELLRMRNTQFIVALNKVDRLYGWKTCHNAPFVEAMKQQTNDVRTEFNLSLTRVITQFKEQGLNTELYSKNEEMGETYSIVPTSAISGEGIPNLLSVLVQWTQKTMVEKLTYSQEVQCTVLEVKVIEGHGTTIDVVLVNGVLHVGDQIVCGTQGSRPIVTTIRALLTPHPMKELQVKGTYLRHKKIKAAQFVKISAQGLEHAVAGTGLYVVGSNDDLENAKEVIMEDRKSVLSSIDKSGKGVCVQASTHSSLEALLVFLKEHKIPVRGVSIGPVHKKDVMKARAMLEEEYATILAFDVKVTPEARQFAGELGVKIFNDSIIFHLYDQFKAYSDILKEEKKKESADEVVFPCNLKILPGFIFNTKNPIILGVEIHEGVARVGTPICACSNSGEYVDIGRIASIHINSKPVDFAKKGQEVSIQIVGSNPEEKQIVFGGRFGIKSELFSHITRRSIDLLKAYYRDELTTEDWKLVVKLKTKLQIL